jgi:hypothetical protein
MRPGDPYVPVNKPSIGDMFDYFDFHEARAAVARPPRLPGGGRTSSQSHGSLS